jgi:flagellar biosynthesis chaperone FliJ
VLLEQKLEAQEQSQRRLAERQKELAGEQKAFDDLTGAQQRIEQVMTRTRQTMLTSGGEVQGILFRRDYLRGLKTDLEAAKDAVLVQRVRVQEFEQRVSEGRQELAECSRQVEILKKHRERLAKRFAREQEAHDAKEQDEMGNLIYLRRRQS